MNKIKWLVMIYLAGDNNLSEECVYAITEMKRIGSSKDVAIFAQLDTAHASNFVEPAAGQQKELEQRAKQLANTVSCRPKVDDLGIA